MAAHNEKKEAERREKSWRRKIWRKLRPGSISSKGEVHDAKEKQPHKVLSKPGQDVESAIPPDGKREKLGDP